MHPLRSFSQLRRRIHGRNGSAGSIETASSLGSTSTRTPETGPFELAADSFIFELPTDEFAPSPTSIIDGLHELPADNEVSPLSMPNPPCELPAPTPGWHIPDQRDKLYGGFYEPRLSSDQTSPSNLSRPQSVFYNGPDYMELAKRQPPAPPIQAQQLMVSPFPEVFLGQSQDMLRLRSPRWSLNQIREERRRAKSAKRSEFRMPLTYYLPEPERNSRPYPNVATAGAQRLSCSESLSVSNGHIARASRSSMTLPIYG